jgi:nicotinamidase-related amidase
MDKFFLEKSEVVLVIVDIQDRLAAVMDERKKVVDNCLHLIELTKLLDIPVILNEQYPKGLGPTVSEIKEALQPYEPLEKLTFSCCKGSLFMDRLAATGRKKIILTGMETHVCVVQTCVGLLDAGYTVHTVSDAICSRTRESFQTAIEFMRDAGAVITCTETVLFQLLEKAGTEEFKIISKRIK